MLASAHFFNQDVLQCRDKQNHPELKSSCFHVTHRPTVPLRAPATNLWQDFIAFQSAFRFWFYGPQEPVKSRIMVPSPKNVRLVATWTAVILIVSYYQIIYSPMQGTGLNWRRACKHTSLMHSNTCTSLRAEIISPVAACSTQLRSCGVQKWRRRACSNAQDGQPPEEGTRSFSGSPCSSSSFLLKFRWFQNLLGLCKANEGYIIDQDAENMEAQGPCFLPRTNSTSGQRNNRCLGN